MDHPQPALDLAEVPRRRELRHDPGRRLSLHLQESYGIYLNGVVLISPVLNRQHKTFRIGNDLPYVIYLPTYAATAWYHHKLPPELAGDLQATLAEVAEFALGDYASALLLGDRLAPDDRRRIAERVARYTGPSVDYVERSNLRILIYRFVRRPRKRSAGTAGNVRKRFSGASKTTSVAWCALRRSIRWRAWLSRTVLPSGFAVGRVRTSSCHYKEGVQCSRARQYLGALI